VVVSSGLTVLPIPYFMHSIYYWMSAFGAQAGVRIKLYFSKCSPCSKPDN